MSELTNTFGFLKPEKTDKVDIDVLNGNMDLLDATLTNSGGYEIGADFGTCQAEISPTVTPPLAQVDGYAPDFADLTEVNFELFVDDELFCSGTSEINTAPDGSFKYIVVADEGTGYLQFLPKCAIDLSDPEDPQPIPSETSSVVYAFDSAVIGHQLKLSLSANAVVVPIDAKFLTNVKTAVYSNTERLVGEFFGKPLYEISITEALDGSDYSTTTEIDLDDSITYEFAQVSNCVLCTVDGEGASVTVPSYYMDATHSLLAFYNSGKIIVMLGNETLESGVTYALVVTVQYVKGEPPVPPVPPTPSEHTCTIPDDNIYSSGEKAYGKVSGEVTFTQGKYYNMKVYMGSSTTPLLDANSYSGCSTYNYMYEDVMRTVDYVEWPASAGYFKLFNDTTWDSSGNFVYQPGSVAYSGDLNGATFNIDITMVDG